MKNKYILLIISILVISLSASFVVYGNDTPIIPLPSSETSQKVTNGETVPEQSGGYETPTTPMEEITSSTKATTTNPTTTKPVKKANTLTAKGKTKTLKYATLKKKNITIARKNIITVSKPQGKVTYKKSSGSKKITINKSTGKVTVKKGLKKGTYKVKIKVTAAGNATYKAATKTVTVTIKVKK